jgi:transposase-like protein
MLTAEQSAKLVQLYRDGLPYRAIARRLGMCGHDMVTYHLRKHGIVPNRVRGFRGGKKPEIVKLAKDGWSNEQIAVHLGVAKGYVSSTVTKARAAGEIIQYDNRRNHQPVQDPHP